MSYSGNHITDPVSINDVRNAIGSGDTDIATLCMSNNVTMKSAYKPVYMAKYGQLTDSDLAIGRANAVNGYTISYGIKIRKSKAVADYIDTNASAQYFPVKDAPWEYDKPVLDGTNVFRLTDFYNYWNNADWAMSLTMPSSSYVYVPKQSGISGQTITFRMNWNYSHYGSNGGWLSPQQIFAAIQNYYPSILMTCFYQGGSWNYAKSAGSENNKLTIGQIGASSAQSGTEVFIDTKDLYECIKIDDSVLNSLIDGRKWTACWVLLPTWMSGKSNGTHKVFFQDVPSNNIEVVRLQLPSPSTVVDRIVLTLVDKKKSYISSISIAVTVVKQTTTPSSSGGFHRWNVSSIVMTFQKETSDSITFVLKGKYSCQVGNAYGQGTTDSDGRYTINNAITISGSGTKTVSLSVQDNTLAANTIWYDPTAAETGSNVIRFSGNLYLLNSSFGDWQGSYGIESQPSEPYGTLTRNINLV